MFGIIFSGVIFGFCALLTAGIGIRQIKSREPVGFYTGEKPLSKEQVTDVPAWNRKHGTMFILYGVCIMAAWLCGMCCKASTLSLIFLIGGVIAPIFFMMLFHRRMKKRYLVR